MLSFIQQLLFAHKEALLPGSQQWDAEFRSLHKKAFLTGSASQSLDRSCERHQATSTTFSGITEKHTFACHSSKHRIPVWGNMPLMFVHRLVINKLFFFRACLRRFVGNLYPLNCLYTPVLSVNLSCLSISCLSDVELFTQAHQLTFHSHLNWMSLCIHNISPSPSADVGCAHHHKSCSRTTRQWIY